MRFNIYSVMYIQAVLNTIAGITLYKKQEDDEIFTAITTIHARIINAS